MDAHRELRELYRDLVDAVHHHDVFEADADGDGVAAVAVDRLAAILAKVDPRWYEHDGNPPVEVKCTYCDVAQTAHCNACNDTRTITRRVRWCCGRFVQYGHAHGCKEATR